ncbi:MAG: hypothetical protein CSA13_01660 [Clostridiales bacterium]|nr:MAG: hypothetical protein CSA13_01660 [Clostridiales bacterium]
MKRVLAIGLILVLVMSSVACSGNDAATNQSAGDELAVSPDVVAQVDDETIEKAVLSKAFTMLALNYQAQYGPDVLEKDVNGKKLADIMRRELLDNLINEVVVRAYLEADGFTLNAADLEKNFQIYKEALAKDSKSMQVLTENDIDDDFIKQRIAAEMYLIEFYDRIKQQLEDAIDLDSAEMANQVIKVEAQHILLPTLEEANQVIERLADGEAFADLAKTLSQDPGSAASGGNLGEFGKGMMVKPFEDAAFSLKVGEVSQPVETQFGFHIIKLNKQITVADIKAKPDGAAELAQIKKQLAESQLSEVFTNELDKLRAGHEIKAFPENLVEPAGQTTDQETTTTTE